MLALDQITKAQVLSQLGPAAATHHYPLLPGLIEFDYVENRGAAFGLFRDAGWVLALLALGVSLAILYLVPRLGAQSGVTARLLLPGLGLVLGGALGNLVDRVQYGYVIDFITPRFAQITLGNTLYRFPTFNVADSAITVSMLALLLGFLLTPQPRRSPDAPVVARKEHDPA